MDNWASILRGHPIFKPSGVDEKSFNLSSLDTALPSTSGLQDHDLEDALPPKRKAVVVRDNDVVVAVGTELRVASVESGASKAYTTLRAPELDFEIKQIVVNSSRNLLAISGDTRVVVVVLPRAGVLKVAGGSAECKALPIGRLYHAPRGTSPVAKVDWHPLGEAGASLLVMTKDGKLREYDVSANPNEPLQTFSFVPEKKTHSYAAEDPFARQAVSFTFGQGDGDWSLLTLYAAMRNGDIYAICPFLPTTATLPSSYLFALDGFVAEKRRFLSAGDVAASASPLASVYDQQRTFTSALLRQLPSDITPDSISTPVLISAPKLGKVRLRRQGPFLLQPAPRLLPGEGGDTVDILYHMAAGSTLESGPSFQIGILIIANQDGRTDICLDLEKVEARWENEGRDGLPTVMVYETIDLGITHMASLSKVDLAEINHPVLMADPVHDEAVYIYHAFGAHSLDLTDMLMDLAKASTQESATSATSLRNARGTIVRALAEPLTPQSKPDPVIALGVSADSFSASSLLTLTASWNVRLLPLADQSLDATHRSTDISTRGETMTGLGAQEDKPAYVSLLSAYPFVPSTALQPTYSTLVPRIVGTSTSKSAFTLTTASLRQLSTTVESFQKLMQAVQRAQRETEARATLQRQEHARQKAEYTKVLGLLQTLRAKRQDDAQRKLDALRAKHAEMLKRTEAVLKRLMLRASPELNEHETRWFHELSRMKEEVYGFDKYDDQSLNAKADRLRIEVDRLMPQLSEVKAHEPARWELVTKADLLGTSQAFQLGIRSQSELRDIRGLEKQVAGLAAKMDISLSQSPVGQSGRS